MPLPIGSPAVEHRAAFIMGRPMKSATKPELSRRDALKLAGGAVLATVALQAAEPAPRGTGSSRPKRIIVAGGGIGGLCCGYELVRRGHDVTILEAAARAGGHVRTAH